MMAELDARANKLARKVESEGGGLPIRFQFVDSDGKMGETDNPITTTIDIPEVCFVNMLKYLSGKELVDSSLVSKVWCSASRLPIVWEDGVDMSRFNLDKKLNMTSFLKLLERPQFANLKALALPYKVKLGKNSVKQLAKLLPHLELFDPGYYSHNTKCTNSDLIAATEHFTCLTSLRADMESATSYGIEVAVRAMGERLTELKVHAYPISRNYLSGQAMETIMTSCPNLKHFAYRCGSYNYDQSLDGVTGDRVVRLVETCRRLESLALFEARNVACQHFLQIAKLVANDLDGFALQKIVANGYSGFTPSGMVDEDVSDPFDIQSLLAAYTFLEVKAKFVHPRLEKGIMFWSEYGE